jgi:hypothetical protein
MISHQHFMRRIESLASVGWALVGLAGLVSVFAISGLVQIPNTMDRLITFIVLGLWIAGLTLQGSSWLIMRDRQS